jgi:hypothetical protein
LGTNFWTDGWSILGNYEVWAENRRFKLSDGSSLGTIDLRNDEHFFNIFLTKKKIVIYGQSFWDFRVKIDHLSVFEDSIEGCF